MRAPAAAAPYLPPHGPRLPEADGRPRGTPPARNAPLDWLLRLLGGGAASLRSRQSALFRGARRSSLFEAPQPSAGLLRARQLPEPLPQSAPAAPAQPPRGSPEAPAPSEQAAQPARAPPSSPAWANWKKITVDFYIRLVDTPSRSRLRLKQTVALLPVVKLKPVIDLAYRGPARPPLTMHLDVKLLDCIKYRVRTDGSSLLQVRARAPLSDPRFVVDVTYERQLPTALDSVKVSFRALDFAFFKAPKPACGIKFPIRFGNGIKNTLRVNKVFVSQPPDAAAKHTRKSATFARPVNRTTPNSNPYRNTSQQPPNPPPHTSHRTINSRLGLFGPIGLDIKLRCLEYR